MSQSPILVFNVTQKDRVKGLYLGCHYKGPVTNTTDGAMGDVTTAVGLYGANAANNSGNHVKDKISTMVKLPIQYLHFNFGGETRVFTLNQLNVLGFARVIEDKHSYYNDPSSSITHEVLYLDMQRFCNDVFGSSNQSAMNIQVQI
jgi:hypothetical protein